MEYGSGKWEGKENLLAGYKRPKNQEEGKEMRKSTKGIIFS